MNLQRLLAGQEQVNWVQTPTNSEQPPESVHVTATLADVKVDGSTCTLTYKDGRVFPDQHYDSLQTWTVRIPAIDRIRVDSLEAFVNRYRTEGGHPSWGTKTTPVVFTLQMFAAAKQSFEVHRWSKNGGSDPIERDLHQPMAFIIFAGEAAARETAKALDLAKDSCARQSELR